MAELILAVATVVAVAAVASALPAVLRASADTDARSRLTPPLVMMTGGALVTFSAYLAFDIRCTQQDCPPGSGDGPLGLDGWWRRHDSWQWSAQLGVAAVGLAAAAIAFALAARRSRRAAAPLWAARVLYALWVVGVFGLAAVSELAA